MYARPTDLAASRRTRRPTRFRANVEPLDRRALLAAGATGTVVPVTGNVDAPLQIGLYAAGSVGIGGVEIPRAPVGTPIPLVGLTSGTSTALTTQGYTGTVDWGDGTATDAAVFNAYDPNVADFAQPGQIDANGPEHTYTTPGTFTITVSVTGPGDTAPMVYHDTATISAAPPLTGQLSRFSDTGFSDDDNITADNTPDFVGTTQPGASVVLTTTSIATGQSLVVGSAVADASGNWSVVTVPFVDGTYSFSATATSTFGGSTTTSLIGSLLYPDNIRIDATGPKVSGFQITNFQTGTFEVYYTDPAGLLLPGTVNASNYSVTRTTPKPTKGQTFSVSGLTVQGPVDGSTTPTISGMLVPVVGKFTTGKPIPKNGTYVFTIASAGIVGLSGATLDGEFAGNFPSGNGQAGSNYQVKITVRNGKVSGPIPLTQTKATPAAASLHAQATPRVHARAAKLPHHA